MKWTHTHWHSSESTTQAGNRASSTPKPPHALLCCPPYRWPLFWLLTQWISFAYSWQREAIHYACWYVWLCSHNVVCEMCRVIVCDSSPVAAVRGSTVRIHRGCWFIPWLKDVQAVSGLGMWEIMVAWTSLRVSSHACVCRVSAGYTPKNGADGLQRMYTCTFWLNVLQTGVTIH